MCWKKFRDLSWIQPEIDKLLARFNAASQHLQTRRLPFSSDGNRRDFALRAFAWTGPSEIVEKNLQALPRKAAPLKQEQVRKLGERSGSNVASILITTRRATPPGEA